MSFPTRLTRAHVVHDEIVEGRASDHISHAQVAEVTDVQVEAPATRPLKVTDR
jgi:hypothetical protein